jgi:hypothetical protein
MNRSISGFDVDKVELKYGATFIGDFPTKLKNGGWGDCGAVFYQHNPQPHHSPYFGLYIGEKTVIYDASYLLTTPFTGVKVGDGYVWSRHVQDFREVPGGFIDGGFDYFRCGGNPSPKAVSLKIEGAKVVEC